jgi:hypothetical protein
MIGSALLNDRDALVRWATEGQSRCKRVGRHRGAVAVGPGRPRPLYDVLPSGEVLPEPVLRRLGRSRSATWAAMSRCARERVVTCATVGGRGKHIARNGSEEDQNTVGRRSSSSATGAFAAHSA